MTLYLRYAMDPDYFFVAHPVTEQLLYISIDMEDITYFVI